MTTTTSNNRFSGRKVLAQAGGINWANCGKYILREMLFNNKQWRSGYNLRSYRRFIDMEEEWRIYAISVYLATMILRLRWRNVEKTINSRIRVKKAILIQKAFRGQAVRNRYPPVWKWNNEDQSDSDSDSDDESQPKWNIADTKMLLSIGAFDLLHEDEKVKLSNVAFIPTQIMEQKHSDSNKRLFYLVFKEPQTKRTFPTNILTKVEVDADSDKLDIIELIRQC